MQFIPIKTLILLPPQDDLFPVLEEYLTETKEEDIILFISKVINPLVF